MLDRLRRRLPVVALRTLPSVAAYSLWAAAYPPHAHNALMRLEEDAMLALMPPLGGCVVLDVACGTGRYSRLALAHGARLALGVDNSLAMLRASAQPLRALADAEALPLPAAAVDVVICALALGHLPTLGPALREISRVLRPGGSALLSDFHPFVFLSGGQRTFIAPDGMTYAVEHYPHLYADYHQAAQASGLHITGVREAVLPAAEAARLDHPGMPVVLVLRLEKSGA
jgi:malonyl-CoA O-methyltransferase